MPLYVYALTGEKASPFVAGGHRIEWIEAEGVHAAVERLEGPPALSEAALREQHDIVVRIAAAVEAVLPARFGSICDPGELRHIVASRRDAICTALELVSGREQMTVRTPGGERPDSPMATGNVSGAEYLKARREAAARRLPSGLERLRDAVKGLVVAERVQPASGKMGPAVYHLIARGAAPAYRKAIATMDPCDQAGTVSGPWPPFAFAPEWLP